MLRLLFRLQLWLWLPCGTRFLAEEMNARRSAVTIFNRQGGATWYVSRNRQPRPLHGKRKPGPTLSRAGNAFASARAVPALQGIRGSQRVTPTKAMCAMWESEAEESSTQCV